MLGIAAPAKPVAVLEFAVLVVVENNGLPLVARLVVVIGSVNFAG